jgi:hypothetical protein
MKLSAQTITSLDNLLSLLNVLGIEKVVIENGKIRALDEKKTVGMITDQYVPDLDGKVLGINSGRVKALRDRFSLIKSQGDLSITANLDGGNVNIVTLDLSGGKSSSKFRCALADMVKVPKMLNDAPAYEVLVSIKQIPLIASADAAMATDSVLLTSKDGKNVSFEFIDNNKDVYVFDIERPAKALSGKNSSFSFTYTSKSLISLMRESAKTATDDVKLMIGAQGIAFIDIAGYNFFTLPKA